jgi:hypothetical protein
MSHRCLFLDDWHIGSMEGLKRQGHPAQRYPGNPILAKTFPWEQCRVQLYGRCIVHNPETQRYQMYYIAQPRCEHYPNVAVAGEPAVGWVTLPCYAESEDGIHWERPLRPDVSFEDCAQTNILDLRRGPSFEPGILWDAHEPDPQRRYKAFVWDQDFHIPVPGKVTFPRNAQNVPMIRVLDEAGNVAYEQIYDTWGIRLAFSADGIHWRNDPGWAFRCYSDTGQSVLYDARLGKYVAFGRFNNATFTTSEVTYGKDTGTAFNIGRNVARVESEDFLHWSEPELVLAADSHDPDSFQINSMPVDLYEGLYIGLMEVDVRPHPNPLRPIQLAASRDSRHWTHVADRFDCLAAPAPDAWDSGVHAGWVRPATGLFVRDEEVRMYYNAGPAEDPFAGIGMARWRRDGFVSLHAGESGGTLLTRPFIPDGPTLHLNIAAPDGEVTVRVCDIQGRAVETWTVSRPSATVRGDHTDIAVDWRDSDFGTRIGKPVSLRIEMRSADLYSFWTT